MSEVRPLLYVDMIIVALGRDKDESQEESVTAGEPPPDVPVLTAPAWDFRAAVRQGAECPANPADELAEGLGWTVGAGPAGADPQRTRPLGMDLPGTLGT